MNFIDHITSVLGGSVSVWTYIILFLVSFFDTLIVVGAFFPASFFVIAAGFFVLYSDLNPWMAAILIILGGLIGDLLSYFVGRKGTNWFKYEKKILNASYLDKGKEFFSKYGDKSIIFGRFLGIVKSIIPFVAGLIKMNLRKFLFLNILASLLWTFVHLGIGYLLGKTFNIFHVPKHVKYLILVVPFMLFFLWTAFEYRKDIFNLFKKKKVEGE